MARRLARSAPRGCRSVRRPGTWARAVDVATTVASGTKVLLTSFTLSNAGIDETIRRAIGGIWAASAQQAATQSFAGAVGMCVVTEAALAAGAASIPGPVTEGSDDVWFMWTPVSGQIRVVTAVGIDGTFGAWFPFDSRAMRRVQEGQAVAVMAEVPAALDGMSVQFNASVFATLAT